MLPMNEKVILVDENDQPIGLADKLLAHQQALLHRAFSVFIYQIVDNTYQLLLQQRQLDKYHGGGLWTNTCCSHPRHGETTLMAAQRRLNEEMDLNINLISAGSFIYKAVMGNGLTEYEFDYVFNGFYSNELIKVNPQEVAAYRWVTLAELTKDLSQYPKRYTPWLKQALEISVANLD